MLFLVIENCQLLLLLLTCYSKLKVLLCTLDIVHLTASAMVVTSNISR